MFIQMVSVIELWYLTHKETAREKFFSSEVHLVQLASQAMRIISYGLGLLNLKLTTE